MDVADSAYVSDGGTPRAAVRDGSMSWVLPASGASGPSVFPKKPTNS